MIDLGKFKMRSRSCDATTGTIRGHTARVPHEQKVLDNSYDRWIGIRFAIKGMDRSLL